MRNITVAALLTILLSAQTASAQSSTIRVFIDPVLLKDLYNKFLIDAITSAFSKDPFVRTAKLGDGVLMITETEKPNFREGSFQFSVSFFRNGVHLADSIESCSTKKISDCSDQLASDAKDAASIDK